EGHEVDAVRKLVKDIGCDLQAETRFAGTTRSGQRQEPGLLQQLLGLANLVVAPDEARQLCGKIVRRRLERLQRWEILRETFNGELKQALRLGQVFEAMQAEVFQRQPGWQRVINQRPGGFRDEHLPPMAGARHPGGSMDVKADVLVTDEGGLARVDADPYAHDAALRPLMRVQRLLRRRCASAGLQCAVEHNEEGIAFGPELVTAIGGARFARE